MKVKIHKTNNFQDGLFDVTICQDEDPRKTITFCDMTVGKDNAIIWDDPGITTFSPVDMLPWIKRPRDLLNHK